MSQNPLPTKQTGEQNHLSSSQELPMSQNIIMGSWKSLSNANSQRQSLCLLLRAWQESVWACDTMNKFENKKLHKCVSFLSSQKQTLEKASCLVLHYSMLLWRRPDSPNLIFPSVVVVSDSSCLSLQYRAPYMPPTQQYPVTSGTAGFYPGTSPAEYPAYGKSSDQVQQQPSTTIKDSEIKAGEISKHQNPKFNRFLFKHDV